MSSILLKHKPVFTRRQCRQCIVMASRKRKEYQGIGDKCHFLTQLSDKEFVKEINSTRKRFVEKYPELREVVFEYKKQSLLLDLDFWYEIPVPKRCERFLRIDIMSLMDNVDEDSEEGQNMKSLIDSLLHKYQTDEPIRISPTNDILDVTDVTTATLETTTFPPI